MLADALSAMMLAAARAPRRVAGVVAGLVVAALVWISLAFAMTTDTGELISAQTPWRQDGTAIEAAFPQLKDAILVVVVGQTSELTEEAAARLAETLSADTQRIATVRRPDGGPFLASEGLLFANLAQVQSTTKRLIDAQPLLGGLAADPSLHGIATTLATVADGAARPDADPIATARLAEPLAKLAASLDARAAGRATYFSWGSLFSDANSPLAPPTRQVLIIHPHLRFGDLEPGEAAVSAINAAAARLHLDTAHGVRIGITGEVPLADEEFGSIAENIGVVGALMLAAMLVCLWAATTSARMVAAIVTTILAGLIMTLAAGLLAVGRLNLISVAFIPLFVGLGVDFGIQVAVRFNAERRAGAAPTQALTHLAAAIGAPLALAAAAIVLALGAFLPTAYVGIAELGVIAGIGMIIAFVLNVTLLPALLIWWAPAVPARDVGWAGGAALDDWLLTHRKAILGAFVAAMVASVALLPRVVFDFNPLHLRDPHGPAMAELTSLMKDATRTPNTIAILARNVDAADALAEKLAKRPEVAQAITIDSYVPEGQPAKLALIQDASLLLDAAINPFDMAPPAEDTTTAQALRDAAAKLTMLAKANPPRPLPQCLCVNCCPAIQEGGQHAAQLAASASHLAAALTRLAAAPPQARADASQMLVPPLATTLNQLRASLTASPITRESLPPEIRADWLAKDGRALVQVSPAGNSTDNAVLARFTKAVLALAPHATGLPIATQAAAHTVATAFVEAGVLALLLVSALLYAVLRSLREVAFTLAPVVLSGFLTLGSCVLIGQPLNFANIIAFPLLVGVGVAFHIYFVMAWRRGVANLLASSLARAVVMSALATGSAFGALWFSHHPGTASMGLILMISLVWTLVCALIFEPALLGPVTTRARQEV